jgi:hypothetical protein
MSDKKEFIVLKAFRDKDTKEHHAAKSLYSSDEDRVKFLQDKGFLGKEVSEVRAASAEKEDKEEKFPKHTGGGYFELSNGEKVKGKDEAAAAEKELAKEGE